LLSDFEPLDAKTVADLYLDHAERLRPFVRDTTAWLHEALERGRRLLFEGAQGSLLDVDHGSYPYVTSSNSSAAGIPAGSGVPTRHIDRWIGVVKAYTTRRRRAVSDRAG
jgi:adenylosuccinate synthase